MRQILRDAGRYWGQFVRAENLQSDKGHGGVMIEFDLTHKWVGSDADGKYDSIDSFALQARYYYTENSANQEIFMKKMKVLGFKGDFGKPRFEREAQWLKSKGGGEELLVKIDDWGKGPRNSLEIKVVDDNMGGSKSMSTDQVTQMNAVWAQQKANESVTTPEGQG